MIDKISSVASQRTPAPWGRCQAPRCHHLLTGVINVQFIHDTFISTTKHYHQIFNSNGAMTVPGSRTRSRCVCNPLPFQYGCCHFETSSQWRPISRMWKCPDASTRMLRCCMSRDYVYNIFFQYVISMTYPCALCVCRIVTASHDVVTDDRN